VDARVGAGIGAQIALWKGGEGPLDIVEQASLH
jgi:hypothetical protein